MKICLLTRIRMEPVERLPGLMSTVTLEQEPIELRVSLSKDAEQLLLFEQLCIL